MTNLRELFRDPKEREDLIIGLVVLFLFLGPMLYYLFGRTIDTVQEAIPIEELVDTNNPVGAAAASTVAVATTLDTSEDELSPDDFEEAPNDPKLNSYLESMERNEAVNTSSISATENSIANPVEKAGEKIEELKEKLPPIIEAEGEEFEPKEAPVVAPKEKEEIANPVKEKTDEKKIETPTKEEVIKSTSANTSSSKSNEKTKAATTPKSPYDCFIVLGAYKDLENSKKMIQDVKKRNYPIYQGRQDGKFIVGVNCKCNESDNLLPQLRRDFDPNAFLVKRD